MQLRRHWLSLIILSVLTLSSVSIKAEEPTKGWVQKHYLGAPEAIQAAGADEHHVYVVADAVIAKYDRKTGQKLSVSHGEAHHLNSAFFYNGNLYSAHSNYPNIPEQSEIKVLNPVTMELTNFKEFGRNEHGSLTVAVFHDNAWWCVFARYNADNAKTAFVKYDTNWQEQGVWTFPHSVVSDLGQASISGGVWEDNKFLAIGHDKKVIYQMELPQTGTVLELREKFAVPFPGQGIAHDPVTGGLIGINREKMEVIFAEKQ
jgi:hypothetical protein